MGVRELEGASRKKMTLRLHLAQQEAATRVSASRHLHSPEARERRSKLRGPYDNKRDSHLIDHIHRQPSIG